MYFSVYKQLNDDTLIFMIADDEFLLEAETLNRLPELFGYHNLPHTLASLEGSFLTLPLARPFMESHARCYLSHARVVM